MINLIEWLNKRLRLSMRYKNFLLYLKKAPAALGGQLTMAESALSAKLIRADGTEVDYGVICRRKVTDAFVAFIVAQMVTETSEFGDFKFHDSGVGTTAENNDDTDIETTDGEARVAGTQVAGGSGGARTYTSVGTISYTTSKAITEHGLFSIVTGGTMLDRSVFSAINVVNGDSIQFTYVMTINSET